MLSYQHAYHAGNYADVFKHLMLSRILNYMTQKPKPMFYLDTHAGRGHYDLHSVPSRKTNEAERGIAHLWQERGSLPPLFAPYLACLESVNSTAELRYYPGSPAIAIQLLREMDRLFFYELHPQEHTALAALLTHGLRVHMRDTDGLCALKSELPPSERRGLIMLDPSYEIKAEYKDIPKRLAEAYRRFQQGVYCLWYPIIYQDLYHQLMKGLRAIEAPSMSVEFRLNIRAYEGMNACGLWIINPPYSLKDEIPHLLKPLCRIFSASYDCESF